MNKSKLVQGVLCLLIFIVLWLIPDQLNNIGLQEFLSMCLIPAFFCMLDGFIGAFKKHGHESKEGL